jgi:hypothetical protein
MATSFHCKQGSSAADTLVPAVFMTWTKMNLWLLEMIIADRTQSQGISLLCGCLGYCLGDRTGLVYWRAKP